MKSIIQELQIEATDPTVSVSDLLRKAKIVASKLDLKDLEDWVESELVGYMEATNDELPKYRIVSGEPKVWNPYHGWQPILFKDIDIGDMMAKRGLNQAIGELDDLLKTNSGGSFMIDYNTKAKKQIMEAIRFESDVKFMVGRTAVTGILEAVRNRILGWALKLEKIGILGEGVSFSKEDKQKAQEAKVIYNIGNFAGTIGNVSGLAEVTINQVNGVSMEDLKTLITQIKENSTSVEFNFEDSNRISKITKMVEVEILKEKPEQSKIKSALISLKNIFEGATGNVIAQGILFAINKILFG